MSSAEQATSTSSASNDRLIADALENYAKITGNDLSKNSFAPALEQSDSPEAILKLLQEREKAFKEYREGSRRLINCLSPVVNVLQAFSGILGEAVGLVSHATHTIGSLILTCLSQIPFPPAKALFVGIDILLAVRPLITPFNQVPCDIGVYQAASRVTSSYDSVLNLFECLGRFLKRLEVYTTIPPTPMMTDIIIKVMVELLSVLALSTKQIMQGRFSKCTSTYTLSMLRMLQKNS